MHRTFTRLPLFALVATFAVSPGLAMETPANVPVEISFSATHDQADPFNAVQVELIVQTPSGPTLRVPMFWAGGNTWKARYASPQPGLHRWQTNCSDTEDPGLHGVRGEIIVTDDRHDNPLYRHGPLRAADNKRHFIHADGTPFLWIGDTCWMGLCQRMSWPEDFQRYVADRKEKGFNVIQIVAGLYPDMPAFDPRGANEAGFPWTSDYGRIRPEYFDAADQRLRYLIDQGIVPCLVGAWGYHMEWMGEERLTQHWRYLLARYASWPVVFCVAGEANLPYYLVKGFPFDDRQQVTRWTTVARTVRGMEPFGRLWSIHPTGLGRLGARGAIDDATLLDFDMLQTGHGDISSLGPTVDTARWTYAQQPTMPFLNSEVCYEGILGSCDDSVQRVMTWSSLLSGAAGHTYGANGIWQVNSRSQPYGKSPHGTDYGQTPWDEAMQLPGSAQVGLAGRILGHLPWPTLEPHPEWVALEEATDQVSWGAWIWSPESDSTKHAEVASRYFLREFNLPSTIVVSQATLYVGCDDYGQVWLNGQAVGTQRGWNPAGRFTGMEDLLRPGRNVIAVHGRNMPAPVEQNPAGLLLTLHVAFENSSAVDIVTDDQWKVSTEADADWLQPNFDHHAWNNVRVMVSQGGAPWGPAATSRNPFLAPYCAGTPDGQLRVIYLPTVEPLLIRQLQPNRKYTAEWIDPSSGQKHRIGTVTADPDGTWHPPLPPQRQHDWLLIVMP